jgi:esterase/lipase superfamily enzyme
MSRSSGLSGFALVLMSLPLGFVSRTAEIAARAAPDSAAIWYGIRLPSSVSSAGLVSSSEDLTDNPDDQTLLRSRGLELSSWNDVDETRGVKNHFELDAQRALIQLTFGSIEIGASEVRISGTAGANSESIVETLKSKLPAGYRLTASITTLEALPYVWSALRSNQDSVELSGNVPNETVRRRLVSAAAHIVSGDDANAVVDRLSIRQGAPTGFAEASFSALQQLRALDEGVISLSGQKVYVLGATTDLVRNQQSACAQIVGYLPRNYSCGFTHLVGDEPHFRHHHAWHRHGGGGGGGYYVPKAHQAVNPAKVRAVAELNPEDFDRRIVDLLFATNREVKLDGVFPEFTGERSNGLSFGQVRIRVPEDHKAGHLELPSGFSSFWLDLTGGNPDPKLNFTVSSRQILTPEEWGAVISKVMPNEALVFVHGFNTTFDDAAFRMAQIVWDMQYEGLRVLYSWPSRGETIDYEYDRNSALGARAGFIELLHNLRDEHGIARIHVLAHSMGNFLVTDALANEAGTSAPIRLSSITMAAPDVDKDQFIQSVPRIQKICSKMTLYASSADRALAISKTLAGAIPRAGDVPAEGPISLPGLDTIDVTALGSEMFGLNHTVFATSRELINDIQLLIVDGKSLPRLATERAVPLGALSPMYWQYVP